MKDIFVSDSIVGKSWEGLQASEAFEKGELKSSGGGQSIRIAFRNLSPFPLLLCWISEGKEKRLSLTLRSERHTELFFPT
jgi:hypothetical protein